MIFVIRKKYLASGILFSAGVVSLLSSSAFGASGPDGAKAVLPASPHVNQAPVDSQSRIPTIVTSTPPWVQQPAASTAAPAPAANSVSKNTGMSDQESLLLGVLQNINPPGWVAGPAQVFSAYAPPVSASTPAGAPVNSIAQLSAELDMQKVAILQEYGISKFFERSYQRGQRRINTRVYIFNTVDGAYGGYMLLRQGAGNVIVRGDASSEDQDSISFWQGKTLVTINGPQDDEESKTLVTNMADKLAAISREHGQLPDVLERMPKLGRVKGSERVVMGPLSAGRFIRAPYLSSLNFRTALCCGVADYQVQDPPDRLKVMSMEFQTPGEAILAFNNYGLNFGGRQIQIAAPFGGMCSLYKTNKTYLLFQQKGRQFVIIANARRAESAEYLSRFMY